MILNLNKIHFDIGFGDCTLNELVKVHEVCDSDFDPPLSSRVEIKEYSRKLCENANFVTAKSEGNLAGIVAIYCNDYKSFTAYISSICVLPAYRGNKLGKDLLSGAIEVAKKTNMVKIRLEVGKKNFPAISLYERFNFKQVEERADVFLMELELR